MKKRKRAGFAEALSTTERLFHENEVNTNRMCAGCMTGLAALTAVYGLVCIAGWMGTAHRWTGWMMAGSAVLELLACFHVRSTGYDDPGAKYFILGVLVLISGITLFVYPLTTVFLIFGPTLLSIKYYEPKLTVKITGIAWLVFLLVMTANFILDAVSPAVHGVHLEQETWLWTGQFYLIRDSLIPKTAAYIVEAVIGYRIAKAGRRLVIEQAEASTEAALMSAELSTAAKIQKVSLPEPCFRTPDGKMELAAYIRTAREVGGDFCDYFMINDHLLAVTVADVSDKGLPSAMFAVEAQSYVRFAFSESFQRDIHGDIEFIDLEKAMNAVNRQLSMHSMDGMFVTMWIGCFDTRTGVGKFINAGHTLPYLRHADGTVETVTNEPQLFLGAFEDAELKAKAFRFRAGDLLLLYTDGATDARNREDETFGDERLKAAVTGAVPEKDRTMPESVLHAISGSIESFIGEEAPYDDITLTAVAFAGEFHSRKTCMDLETGRECASEAIAFVNANLKDCGITEECRRKLDVITDEICDNISMYAYGGASGPLRIDVHLGANFITLRFTDRGKPFNPLETDSPDITGEPRIGGYGIYLVKNLADSVSYRYEDGKNILTVENIWNM